MNTEYMTEDMISMDRNEAHQLQLSPTATADQINSQGPPYPFLTTLRVRVPVLQVSTAQRF